MRNIHSTFRRSLILIGLLSTFPTANAFDYTKAGTSFVDNSRTGDLFEKGYYLGGAIGQSNATVLCNGSSSCEDSDTAWKLFGGYKLLDKVSIEGTYLNLGDMHKDGKNSDISAYGAYAVGALPVTKKFDAFAKLGGVYWNSKNTDGDKDGFSLSYGLGAKMTLNETTKIRAEWEKITDVETSNSDETDINVLTVGVELSTF